MGLLKLVVAIAFIFGYIGISEEQFRRKSLNDWYVFANEDTPFCYNDFLPCGPSKWNGYCNHGNQNRQSPVDFSHVDTTQDSSYMNPFYRFNLSSAYHHANFESFFIQNDGHSIQMNFPEINTFKQLRVTYDFLGTRPYQFAGLHFHWGAEGEYGAEHKFPSNHVLEIHLLHWALTYGSLAEALKATSDPEAISVLGILVKICPGSTSTPFAQIVEELEGVARKPSDEMIQVNKQFSISQFLPKSKQHFSYQGSLTTPGCLEIVKWTVFQEGICISQQEIDAFRNIVTRDGNLLDTNHRPLQQIGNRKISYYRN